MSSRSISWVRSANVPVPGGPATGSGEGAIDIAQRIVTRSLKSVTWSECRWVSSTWCRNPGPGMPAAASRIETPRPQSTSRLRPPACTSVAGPARLASGSGEPVPSSVTIIDGPPGSCRPASVDVRAPRAIEELSAL
jgi:hypothetical protein